jgi:carbon storage regulator CsrA
MLVLTRRADESIVVGSSDCLEQLLRVTVVEIIRGKVRLGFEAADGVAVHRSEVWEKIRDGTSPKLAIAAAGLPAAPATTLLVQPRLEIV